LGLPKRYVLSVGTITARKNYLRLVAAVASLKRRGALDFTLVLCGKEGYRAEEVRGLIEALGLQEAVLTLGYVPEGDLPPLYAGAEAFALPSLCEGFGIPLVEAMACGTPVITSRIPVCTEVCGPAALYVDPYDVDDIAEALRRVTSDPELQSRLSAQGPERARRFRWELCARRTLEAYQRAAE